MRGGSHPRREAMEGRRKEEMKSMFGVKREKATKVALRSFGFRRGLSWESLLFRYMFLVQFSHR